MQIDCPHCNERGVEQTYKGDTVIQCPNCMKILKREIDV